MERGAALHICSVSSFWTRLAPSLSHHDEAVKHALVALGAAHQLHRVTSYSLSDQTTSNGSFFAERLEVFMIQQYNKAIAILRNRLTTEPSVKNTTLALVCCLAFICLESLRSNHHASIAHLRNGLRIIESTIDTEDLRCLSLSSSVENTTTKGPFSAADLRDILTQFRDTELCIHCFSSEVPMTLASRLYQYPPSGNEDITAPRLFTSLRECHEARLDLAGAIISRDWQLRHRKGDSQFWLSVKMQEELAYLRQRGLALKKSLEAFITSRHAPTQGTWDYYSYHMDMLHLTSVRAVVELMPFSENDHILMTQTPFFQDEFFTQMADHALAMHEVQTCLASEPPPDLSLETAIIGPLYWVYVYSTVPSVRATVLGILQMTKHKEGPWDAATTLKLLRTNPSETSNGRAAELEDRTQSLRRWGGVADCYEALPGS
jgi:hypothetical protein